MGVILIAAVCIIAGLFNAGPALEWHAGLILTDGEYWRIVTSSFVHTNEAHLWLNMATLLSIAFLFRPKTVQLLSYSLVLSVFVGIGMFYSNYETYRGFSGVLYGLGMAFSLNEMKDRHLAFVLVPIFLIGKTAYEWLNGYDIETAEMIGASVALESHTAGMAGGAVIFVVSLLSTLALKKQLTKTTTSEGRRLS
ncbi:rhombosortase [Vibrio mediterranei]|uniref:rhombosortase n=1 Tax=Vibrio mediterranei TaxID=689 RepID=UPI0040677744